MAKANVVSLLLAALLFHAECNEQSGYGNVNDEAVTATVGSPWPMPQHMTSSPQQLMVEESSFQFVLTSGPCDLVEGAFVRYIKLTFGSRAMDLKFRPADVLKSRSYAGILTSVNVQVSGACKEGQLPDLATIDESYTLTVMDPSAATLTANQPWGVLKGLETFSQLVHKDGMGMFVINATKVDDYPRFKHRGILLDTARHYLSVDVIKTNLDMMAENKFNVFHWHIVDDQSFPYESYTFPKMSRMGAYNPVTHVYTQENIMEIIEYARQRGIRVVPEFDSPGHSQSWGKAITNLLTKCYSQGQFNGNYGPINPAENSTFTFLESFFGEIANVFPDHYVHLGGDEVSFSCWQSNPEIQQFMKAMGFGTNYAKLEEYYMQKLLNIVNQLKKGYIIWQEVVDNGAKVAMDTVVQVWKGNFKSELANVTKMGYETLLSSCWYLDYIGYGAQWRDYYVCDPQDFDGTDAQKQLVKGGEACLWGEYVDDSNLLSRLWPRASAVGERLWSSVDLKDVNAAAPRLEEHRCRMTRRGYPAEPANGPGFCPDEV